MNLRTEEADHGLRSSRASGLCRALTAFPAGVGAWAQIAPLLRRTIPSSGEAIPAIGLGTAAAATRTCRRTPRSRRCGNDPRVPRRRRHRDRHRLDLRRRGARRGPDRAGGGHPGRALATKVDASGREAGLRQIEQSFRDLRASRIDLIAVHNLQDTATQLRTLRDLKQSGRIRYVGLTTSYEGQHARLADLMARETLDFVQVDFALDNRQAGERVLPLARQRGIAVMINLPLGRGRLFSSVRGKALPDWAVEFECRSWAHFPEVHRRLRCRDLRHPRHGEAGARAGQARGRTGRAARRRHAPAHGELYRRNLSRSPYKRKVQNEKQHDRPHGPPRPSDRCRPVVRRKSVTVRPRATGLLGAPMKIGIIGSGHIGGTLGTLWVKAGHPVLFSSRHPDGLKDMVAGLGPLARTGTPADAAAFGEAVLVAVPYGALPQVGRDYGRALAGKVVLDAGNAVAARDGDIANTAKQKGIGTLSQELLPGAHVVRAFNTLGYRTLATTPIGPARLWPSRSPGTTPRRCGSPRPWCGMPVSSRSWSGRSPARRSLRRARRATASELTRPNSARCSGSASEPPAGGGRGLAGLSRAAPLHRGRARGGPALGLGWLYIFVVLSSYYIMRPIRDQTGVAGGVNNLQWLFTGTLAGMLALNMPVCLAGREIAAQPFHSARHIASSR